jgi:hypothetical protein
MVDGQVYETDLNGLREWVAEGCFHVTDKVKKGSLNWIEAGKVPMLRRLFSGEEMPGQVALPPPEPVAANTQPIQSGAPTGAWGTPFPQPENQPSSFGSNAGFTPAAPAAPATPNGGGFVAPMPPVPANYRPVAACYNHPDLAPRYMCKNCANIFCNDCVKFINGRIAICTLCGELCDPFEKVRQQAVREQFRSSGFGFEDFGSALAYPFRHPVSLIGGIIIYAILLLAGLFGNIAAYMLLFGCMTQVVQNVAWGRLDRNFFNDEDFSFWDDMIHPAILGIGITLISWGPTLVLLIVLLFNIMNSVRSGNAAAMSGSNTESAQVSQEDLNDLNSDDPAVARRAAQKVENQRNFSDAGSSAKQREARSQMLAMQLLASSLPILGLMFLTMLWGILYYPMALTVAGYTQQFTSVINPLVGLDTIKRMGATYWKAFFMYAAVGLVGLVFNVFIMIITAPFEMPIVGNVPGKVLNGTITFYTYLVISCILGLSLHKSADKLNIATD